MHDYSSEKMKETPSPRHQPLDDGQPGGNLGSIPESPLDGESRTIEGVDSVQEEIVVDHRSPILNAAPAVGNLNPIAEKTEDKSI